MSTVLTPSSEEMRGPMVDPQLSLRTNTSYEANEKCTLVDEGTVLPSALLSLTFVHDHYMSVQC